MKKTLFMLALTFVSAAVCAGEILVNTDFSKGLENYVVYKEKGPRVEPEIITEGKVKVLQFAKPLSGYANVYQKIDLKPGDYIASYEVKADPGEPNSSYAYVYGRVFKDGRKKALNFIYFADSRRKKGDTSWRKVSRKFTVPANGKTSLIHFVVHPKYEGTVLFRNFSIKKAK